MVRRNPEVEHERAVAIFDLLEENFFSPGCECADGPYELTLAIHENRLVFDIRGEDGAPNTPACSFRWRRSGAS